MTTWLFQGNPTIFDLDGYLEATPGAITWLAKQNAQDIKLGDTVFLWRSKGKGKESKPSGVVASAEVISVPSIMPDEPESHPFWIDKSKVGTNQLRVWLKIVRVAKSKEVLKREWLLEDACLKNMHILKQAAGTNFKLTSAEAERLRKMWSRVGQNWTRSESIAGLWAYIETYGMEVSRSTASPVGKVSNLTGRSISGVYNKLMNFRSIDPRDDRKGMSGAGQTDRDVWPEFFDASTQTLNEQAIRAEFARIWGTSPVEIVTALYDNHAEAEVFGAEVGRLLSRSLAELMAAYNRQRKQSKTAGNRKPKIHSGRAVLYDRNPLVVAIAKARASNTCEAPECSHELFVDAYGVPYCEVHHIVPLSEGGADEIENVVCLCPTHHREAHFGKIATDLHSKFIAIRSNALTY